MLWILLFRKSNKKGRLLASRPNREGKVVRRQPLGGSAAFAERDGVYSAAACLPAR